ncbi:hypothetical protein AB0F81_45340 [Actinoplanes sp. NPDC024001]|uniref:hypothetical protein n=1 Tax=Actinoplanes sp. NPDC024001 TaxID=3154598 RepID=UPI0033EE8CD2
METTRWRTALALGVLLAALASGCAGSAESPTVATAASSDPKATGTATPTASVDPDAPLKHARCMRANGMTWFPDPQDGRMAVELPANVDREKLEAAEEACRQYAPDGGEKPRMDPELLEQARQMAKCMRENGVPNFPDPDPDGSSVVDGSKVGMGPGDPVFDKAEQACSKYRPSGAVEQHREAGSGGGGV